MVKIDNSEAMHELEAAKREAKAAILKAQEATRECATARQAHAAELAARQEENDERKKQIESLHSQLAEWKQLAADSGSSKDEELTALKSEINAANNTIADLTLAVATASQNSKQQLAKERKERKSIEIELQKERDTRLTKEQVEQNTARNREQQPETSRTAPAATSNEGASAVQDHTREIRRLTQELEEAKNQLQKIQSHAPHQQAQSHAENSNMDPKATSRPESNIPSSSPPLQQTQPSLSPSASPSASMGAATDVHEVPDAEVHSQEVKTKPASISLVDASRLAREAKPTETNTQQPEQPTNLSTLDETRKAVAVGPDTELVPEQIPSPRPPPLPLAVTTRCRPRR